MRQAHEPEPEPRLETQEPDECEHQYREIETAPLGVVCIHCGHFIGAWE